MPAEEYQYKKRESRRGLGSVIVFLAIVLLPVYLWWHHGHGAGRTLPETTPVTVALPQPLPDVTAQPLQQSLPAPHVFQLNGYTLTALASYVVTARVLGTEDYYTDRESQLAPRDLALGWGRMSNSAVLSKITISQGGRFYHWHVADFPIPQGEIESSSANTHIIPASKAVEAQIKALRKDQIVTLGGYLVSISHPDGWSWTSSMTRADTGDGACEVLYTEYVTAR